MPLFRHQQHALQLAAARNIALFHDCGTGKTCTGLHIIRQKKKDGFGPALVVCPLSIIESAWIDDCRRFTPELSIVSLHSSKPAERLKRLQEKHDIYVINFEAFKGLWDAIQAKEFDVLIVDESSKMKCPTTQTTRALLAMAGIKTRAKKGIGFNVEHVVPWRYALSGTPAPNDESEYWGQVKFITGPTTVFDDNHVFNDNYYSFRSKYFYSIPIGRTGQKMFKFRQQSKDEFNVQLSKIAHVVRKEDAVDLPEQVHEIRHVTLSRDEQRAYDTLKNDLVLSFKDEDVLATSSLVEIMKLRQLTSGFCYGDSGVYQIGTSKLNELKEILEEVGKKQVLIWANFRHEIGALLKALPNSAALWSGTVDREAVIQSFKSGQLQYLIANPASAAHGLTFTNCSYAVYFSVDYSYELQKQSQDRIHRIGQNNKCTYYYLVAPGTIDEVILKSLNQKSTLSTEVLSYLRGQHGRRQKQLKTA